MGEIEELIKKIKELDKIDEYKEIIALLPDSVLDKYKKADLFCWRSRAHYELKAANEAFMYAEKAISSSPNNYYGYALRGLGWIEQKEYDKAIVDYSKSIDLKIDYAGAYNNRGLAWLNKREYDKAIADFNKAIQLKNDYETPYNNRGLAWNKKGEYDKAIADYYKSIELNNNNAESYYNRGITWSNKGEYDKAIADYDKAIELKNDHAGAYNNRGNAWLNKKEYDKAIVDYDKSIALKDDDARAFNNRGVAWRYKEEYDKAISDCNKAIDLESDYADAYNNRGVVWHNKGEYEKAIADYDKAIELKNNDANTYRNKGDSLYALGEIQKSIENYKKALELDVNFYYLENRIKLAQEALDSRENLKDKALPDDIVKKAEIETKIEKIIRTIRETAISEVKTVVHYTNLPVADIYVKSLNAKMQYSNAIYMNDPMEGQVFFDYLNDNKIKQAYLNGEKRTETSVYLGSFLPAEDDDGEISHQDELVMWRTYGKDENGKEAAGCSVILRNDFFKMKTKITDETVTEESSEEELLNVVYIKRQKNTKEITNDTKKRIEHAIINLKRQIHKLIKLRDKYNNKDDFYKDIENTIFKNLSKICYLFKSSDYDFEHEVRVIRYIPRNSNEIKFRENIKPNTPNKRFYIESYNEILPYIKKIFLGPKVEHHQQWSLYFDYEIRQRAKEIKDSTDPHKIKPSDIEIIKSECKFQ